MTTPSSVANAYGSIARLANQASFGQSDDHPSLGTPNFGNFLKDAVGSVVDSGRAAEAQGMAMARGQADSINVVTAVSETEVALETMVSIRDKVISAYEEIMRMPI